MSPTRPRRSGVENHERHAVTIKRSAEITLNLPRERAMALFTAEGERSWTHGWDPRYPEPSRIDGPGAVFTTGHGGHQTTWIMVDHLPERVRYARVRVSYDLTALGPAGERWLEAFDASYDSEIAGWGTAITAAVLPGDST